jgi:hypothetical protein
MASSSPADPVSRFETTLEAPLGLDVSKLRACKPRDMAVRFAFGAAVSILAGVITLVAGNRVGGLFLGFPAILPASLTLIDRKDGRGDAETDAAGATFGAIGLVGFAVLVANLLMRVGVSVAGLVAMAGWLAIATGLHAAARALVRHRVAPV